MFRWAVILAAIALAAPARADESASDDAPLLPPVTTDWQMPHVPALDQGFQFPTGDGFTQPGIDQPIQQPTITPTPEPATAAFLTIGGAMLLGTIVRRRRLRTRACLAEPTRRTKHRN